ncbi:ADP-ribosylglycohydrolase family protein [Gordonia jinghuaiqii]|uniref:ADP-ribosylglycohydrolase family protein n=1 Tax=Gordonia jinghuaiqii TaxID=2758710 RepID=A0A7D7QNX7_9ACTN|nr:ADP-ribosylglycohydrolase family protein [Gordonia jinghuaiqii]MCR5979278.1 ADP-ribosylglycohydrolase family protein [Gordonia jinghuaiqii]QMT01066.1 ADP-ribosylglycohydrolase family protein [Gordonia jinghuaiqii]
MDQYVGCLLGGAVGDALGGSVEFLSRDGIVERFGEPGITSYAEAYGGLGTITDDTQMTLFTAEGLLRAWVRDCAGGVSCYAAMTARAYLRWFITQGGHPRHGVLPMSERSSWLMSHRELHSRRAPGNTCLDALRRTMRPGEPASNDSKGCGGVMRVAPVGLFAARADWSPAGTFDLGAALAGLTHGHPSGSLSAGVLAVLIRDLVTGATLDEALAEAKAVLRVRPDHEETLAAIESAEALAASDCSHREAIARLGEGWVGEEALAISIYCALVARDFEDGVVIAVNHDGDSDSTGAITGNLLGARDGVGVIPDRWLEPLELRDVIVEMAGDLHDFLDWEIDDPDATTEASTAGITSVREMTPPRVAEKYSGLRPVG